MQLRLECSVFDGCEQPVTSLFFVSRCVAWSNEAGRQKAERIKARYRDRETERHVDSKIDRQIERVKAREGDR